MVLDRRRHQDQPGCKLCEADSWKIAARGEFPAVKVPFHAHPIIESLKRQMNVLIGFQLDHSEPSIAVDADQIDDAALAGRELRDLPIDGMRIDHRVQRFNPRAHLRFEPGFRMAQI